MAVYLPSDPDPALLSEAATREVRQASRASLGSLAAPPTMFVTESGKAVLDKDGLFRIRVDDRDILWTLEDAATSCRLA